MSRLLIRFLCLPVILITSLLFVGNPVQAIDSEKLYSVRDGFEKRRDVAFERQRGKPLDIEEIREPLKPGRSRYSRHFSYSIVDFAMAAFWNNEQLETANDALIKNAEFYINNRGPRNDRDSFYWAGDVLCRIVEFFGSNGSVAPGRLSQEAEDRIYRMMWLYVKTNSKVNSLDAVHETYENWNWGKLRDRGFPPLPLSASLETDTWDVVESENHHAQKFTVLWHFSKLLREHPEYRNRSYDDGHNASEHHRAWTRYLKTYIRERAGKGLFVEMANRLYTAHTLKGFYNFYDFSEDSELRKLSKQLLDLYFASWAQEQMNGVRSGGRSRVYMHWALSGHTGNTIRSWMWFYLGIGASRDTHGSRATVATSDYRLPPVVMDIALDRTGRGTYELFERRPGLASNGHYSNPHYQLRTDFGGILRYSYVTPDFIMGMPLLEARPVNDWTRISSQNRRQGVIFSAHRDARIVPVCDSSGPTYNEQWGVQKKGAMITQKLPDGRYSSNTKGVKVWFNMNGLEEPTDRKQWAFTKTQNAFAAVRPVRGGYSWEEYTGERDVKGTWMVLQKEPSPVIIQVARARDFSSFTAFQEAVLDLNLDWNDHRLRFSTLKGNQLTLPTFGNGAAPEPGTRPRIDGEPVDLSPEHVFDSPFLRSEWNSGVVHIKKDHRTLKLDFR